MKVADRGMGRVLSNGATWSFHVTQPKYSIALLNPETLGFHEFFMETCVKITQTQKRNPRGAGAGEVGSFSGASDSPTT